MRIQIRINLKFDDSFEKKLLNNTSQNSILGKKFRTELCGFLGYYLDVKDEDKCSVDSLIISKLDPKTKEPELKDVCKDLN